VGVRGLARTSRRSVRDPSERAREAGGDGSADRIGLLYVIGTYPLVTTTFIDREVRLLRRLGADLRIVAVRRPHPGAPLSADQRELQRDVTYLLPVVWLTLLVSHLRFLLRHPGRYLAALIYLLTRPHPDLRTRAKTLLHFGEGVYAAHLVCGRVFREVHAHFADRAAIIALVVSRLLDKPYSLSIHAGADIFVDYVLLPEKIQQARQVVTCTSHNKAHLASVVGTDLSARIAVVPHGLDLLRYQPAPRPKSTVPLVLAVGQLSERKGFAYLIAACRGLKAVGYDFHCRIVGRGPQQDVLQQLVTESELQDRVALCGALPHEEVLEQYERAAIFVLPCINASDGDVDGIPNVLAEAMALRVPIVSTDLPAIRELASDGVNGLLVPPRDVRALGAAMARLLDQPALREQLGAGGHRTVRDMFDAEVNVRRFAATLWPGELDGDVRPIRG
jgi:glycosyltransferase involved in cell wall biosynthesis